ncbi:MAG: hypothetical protein HF314_12175 [Ignavibacteria bacterium]|jgi:hypothetical protein|nr:hypothetical protein [Ignavibacteria bacterium]MCU7503828.1 hypothetical protein [Ignavibacteria bacterium]MCU7517158.1 hypothetical protein [Ignavibacteria bacterium]
MKHSIAILERIIKELNAKKAKLDDVINGKPFSELIKVRNEIHELLMGKNKHTAKDRLKKILELEAKEVKLERINKKDITKIIHTSFELKDEIEDCERLMMDLQLKQKQLENYNNFYSKGDSK